MSLDVAESLVVTGALDLEDLASRFAGNYRWSRGYGPSTARLLKRVAPKPEFSQRRRSRAPLVSPDAEIAAGTRQPAARVRVSLRSEVEQIEQATFQERLFARLASFFGLLALALACVGLYGIMSYGVSRRTNEIGVRMALGARRFDVLDLVVRQGLQLTILGVIFGVASACALTRFLTSFLYGVRPADSVTFGLASLAVIVVSILSSYIPARRATKVDPMVALRYE